MKNKKSNFVVYCLKKFAAIKCRGAFQIFLLKNYKKFNQFGPSILTKIMLDTSELYDFSAMLLGLFKNIDGCMSDPWKVVHFWRIQHGCGILFGESEQHSLSECLIMCLRWHLFKLRRTVMENCSVLSLEDIYIFDVCLSFRNTKAPRFAHKLEFIFILFCENSLSLGKICPLICCLIGLLLVSALFLYV